VYDLGHVAQVEQRVVHKNVRVGFSGSDNPDLRKELTKILMHLALVDGGAAAAGPAILAQTLAQGGWLSGGGGGGGGLARRLGHLRGRVRRLVDELAVSTPLAAGGSNCAFEQRGLRTRVYELRSIRKPHARRRAT
jgi:hypothetical protein